jgi:hypothetical protein
MKKPHKIIQEDAVKEKKKIRSIFGSIKKLPGEFLNGLVSVIPKFIRLALALAKSGKVSNFAKLALIGAVVLIGYSFANLFMSGAAIFVSVLALIGPIAAIASLFFLGFIKLFLFLIAMYAIARICVEMMENEELDKLAKETFGEVEAKEVMKNVQDTYSRLKHIFDPYWEKIFKFLQKLGKKKSKKGINEGDFEDLFTRIDEGQIHIPYEKKLQITYKKDN